MIGTSTDRSATPGSARQAMRRLVLVRHGQSTANAANIFTGWTDVGLTALGVYEAEVVARRLKGHGFAVDAVFTSALERAKRSTSIILAALGQAGVVPVTDTALNERDYGALTGLNKADAGAKWGADQVLEWRRSYAVAPPEGESLRDTAARVLPFYLRAILPVVMREQSVLVVAHGNSLRALVMALDGLVPEQIFALELGTAATLVYELASDTTVIRKTVLN